MGKRKQGSPVKLDQVESLEEGDKSKENSLSSATPPKKRRKTKSKSKTLPEKDDISLQLEAERRQALEIINSMLGSGSGDSRGHEDEKEQSFDEHRAEQADSGTAGQQVETKDTDPIPNSYSVNTDLKKLFDSTAEDGAHTFSFLQGTDEEKEGTLVNEYTQDSADSAQTALPQLSRVEDSEDAVHTAPNAPTYFFFHSTNATLQNRLYEENAFHRSKPLEELEEEWPERRTAMKECFRKRRKDAVKLARKKKISTQK